MPVIPLKRTLVSCCTGTEITPFNLDFLEQSLRIPNKFNASVIWDDKVSKNTKEQITNLKIYFE